MKSFNHKSKNKLVTLFQHFQQYPERNYEHLSYLTLRRFLLNLLELIIFFLEYHEINDSDFQAVNHYKSNAALNR